MQTVGQQLGLDQLGVFDPHPSLVAPDAVGVELELEGFGSSSIRTAESMLGNLWSTTRDGSLRNGGVEFITNGGLGGAVLEDAFTRMHNLLQEVPFSDTFRCSTHMHVNMRDFTIPQVVKFILAYTACEPILFTFCGDYRYSSNFCTPVSESVPFHKNLISRIVEQAYESWRQTYRYCNKYTALNILPMFPDGRNDNRALGTIEFRGSRALTTKEEFLKLANLLLAIKKFVREFEGDAEAMLNHINALGVESSVYAGGISDGLSAQVDRLERAMVNAWLLLKSNQEGQSVASSQRDPREDIIERTRTLDQVVAEMEARGVTGPIRPAPTNDVNTSLIPTSQDPMFDGLQRLGSALNLMNNGDRRLTSINEGIARGLLEVREHGPSASNRFLGHFLQKIGRLSGRHQIGHQYNPIAQIAAGAARLAREGLNVIPTALEAMFDFEYSKISRLAWLQNCYPAGATEEAKERRLNNLVSCIYNTRVTNSVSISAVNSQLWLRAAQSTVRLKNRELLQRRLNEHGLSTLTVPQACHPSYAIILVRAAFVNPVNHIFRGDMYIFKNYCDLYCFLDSKEMSYPVLFIPGRPLRMSSIASFFNSLGERNLQIDRSELYVRRDEARSMLGDNMWASSINGSPVKYYYA